MATAEGRAKAGGQGDAGREVFNDEKIVLVMVGLPARGKSFISHKITNFLSWLGVKAQIFNVGSLRRKLTAGKQSFDFFDASNAAAKQQREDLAFASLQTALQWLVEGGEVAIFDATNTTRERRSLVIERCAKFSADIQVVFVESICDDKDVLESNFMQKVTNSPDYKDMPLEDAMADLRKRIEKYESVYETLEDDNLSYIKLINMQSKVVCNRIYGNMAHLLVPFLMSIHIVDRPIYICRPAHFIKDPQSLSFRELSGIAEGKEATMLSEAGGRFALRLKELLQREMDSKDGTPLKQLRVYSSPAPRALQTIAPLGLDYRPMSALNLVDSGFLAKMPLSEIKTLMATEWADFCRDPMNYRVHGGESIGDLVRRLSSFVVELERQRKPVLVVSHLLNLQLLYGYVFGHLVTDGLDTNIPMYTVIKLTPTQYGFKEERFDLSDDVV
ncbi:hypothetical protein ATCC90586_001871 [Pythium insidiosum]|nr:hypothetical protein ATCC90586_001871 [Pythium insidiosum]